MNQIEKELNENSELRQLMEVALTCPDSWVKYAVDFLTDRKTKNKGQ